MRAILINGETAEKGKYKRKFDNVERVYLEGLCIDTMPGGSFRISVTGESDPLAVCPVSPREVWVTFVRQPRPLAIFADLVDNRQPGGDNGNQDAHERSD